MMRDRPLREQLSERIDAWNAGVPAPDAHEGPDLAALARVAWSCRTVLPDVPVTPESDCAWQRVRAGIGAPAPSRRPQPTLCRLLMPALGLAAVVAMAAGVVVHQHRALPQPHRAPFQLRIASPRPGATVSGDVRVALANPGADASHPYSLWIDGRLAGQTPTTRPALLWKTSQWPNGRHHLQVSQAGRAACVDVVVRNGAPQDGDLVGLVLDAEDRGLARATVVVAGRGAPLHLHVDATGVFEAPHLRPGRYRVKAFRSDAPPSRPVAVRVQSGRTALARLRLCPAARPVAPTRHRSPVPDVAPRPDSWSNGQA